VEFDPGDEFELVFQFERETIARKFAELKDGILAEAIEVNESLPLENRLKLAANEAAGLAWTTAYPLLVFPGLFEEYARRERVQACRQQRIIARTENLIEAIV
jgi:hypothetical protein